MSTGFLGLRSGLVLALLALAAYGTAALRLGGVRGVVVAALGPLYLALMLGSAAVLERRPSAAVVAGVFAGQLLFLVLSSEVSEGLTMIAAFGPMSLAVLYLPGRGALVALVLLTASVAVTMARFVSPAAVVLQASVGMLSLGAFVVAFSHLARSRQEARAELADALARLRVQADQAAELAAVKERSRIAGEIHDSVGHWLTSIHVHLETARAIVDDPVRCLEALDRAADANREALGEVRASVRAIRPSLQGGLVASVEALLAEAGRAGLDARLSVADPGPLPPDVGFALFRIAQEALTNVRRHAAASRVDVVLRRDDERLVLTIRDDGRGVAGDPLGLDGGLRGAQERAAAIGGELTVRSAEGQGLEVRVELAAP